MMRRIYDVLIVGGGPGGYTAALYCGRAGLDTVVFEKLSVGGQIALTAQVDNYPGFEEGVDGFTLGEKMRLGAERFGAVTKMATVVALHLEGDIKRVDTSDGVFYGRTIVLATGAVPRILDVPGEKEMTGYGVHYCATCDGMFYRNKTVVVVGGGNTAAVDAVFLSRICKKVIVVHRRDTLRADKVYQEPLFAAINVDFVWNSTVVGLLAGEQRLLTGVAVKNSISHEETTIDCDGVFVSIGRNPANELVPKSLEMDEAGYIVADESTRTSIPGVYAVGDVRTKVLRQVVTAVADGAVASHYIEEYLSKQTEG